eukprot:TRINITY_DN12281_c0_g1_i3.p1 TRINITY_DN12281_c0_g1~~TRINITY_DN12281_c0_g1_i3.p1  ORF type:complete len:221 (-),score=54.48 TRINITY_DN12281_c0_g1_i3:220-882(-)
MCIRDRYHSYPHLKTQRLLIQEMAKWIHVLVFFSATLLLANGKEEAQVEDELEEYSSIVAGLALIEGKIKKDAKSLSAMARAKGFAMKDFSNKVVAGMLTKFLKSTTTEITDRVIQGIQIGAINSTFNKHVAISYEAINTVALTEEETRTDGKLKRVIAEANAKFHNEIVRGKQDRDVEGLEDSELTWIELVARYNKVFMMIGIVFSFFVTYTSRLWLLI